MRWIRPRFRELSRSRCAMGFLGILLVLFVVARLVRPSRVLPDQIIDECGTYISPGGRDRVRISLTPDGNVAVTMLRPSRRFRLLTTYFEGTPQEFESEREWFCCYDEYDRFWLFVGKWEPQWGESRRMSRGQSWPHVQSVTMEGFWFTPSGLLNGGNLVSSTGYWEGVPTEFFDRIPGKRDDVWGDDRPLPAKAPELSPAQRRQAAAYWQMQNRSSGF